MRFRQLRSARIAGTVGMALGAALLVLACGSGDRTAEDYVPDLSDLGLAILEEGRDPFAPDTVDTWRALYQSSDGRAVIVLVYIETSQETAEVQYATLATALEHPPPEFFGGNAVQEEIESLDFGDERRSFVTAEADDAGNLVWTDIYRSGTAIAIIQLLIQEEGDGPGERREIAEAVLD
jgi:hypothetical protein